MKVIHGAAVPVVFRQVAGVSYSDLHTVLIGSDNKYFKLVSRYFLLLPLNSAIIMLSF